MLSPEEVVERARKWAEIFQYKDEKKPVKGVITKKLKVSYRIYIPKWDVEGRLITKNKFEEGQEVEVVVSSANYVTKQLTFREANYVMKETEILSRILRAKEKHQLMSASVVGVSHGGLILDIMGQRGYIPPSHIPKKYADKVSSLVGKTIKVRILRVRTNNILASLRTRNS